MIDKIRVAEIFESIDGEVNCFHQGRLTTFVRLAGCNLSCKYCDTKKYQSHASGDLVLIKDVVKNIKSRGNLNLTITGGEPLWQLVELHSLLSKLPNHKITIETNGSIDISPFMGLANFVLDYKMDYKHLMLESNWNFLSDNDFVKIVIDDNIINYPETHSKRIRDLCDRIKKANLGMAKIAFSPEYSEDYYKYTDRIRSLISFMSKLELFDVILNVQLHKIVDVA